MKVKALNWREIHSLLGSRAFTRIGSGKRNRAIFIMQLCLGPRIHELLALRVADVIYNDGSIKPSVTFRKTKTGIPRIVDAVNPLYREYLGAWIRELAAAGILVGELPLFPSRNLARPISRQQVYRIYQEAMREAGSRRIGTHSPRKTWAINTYSYWNNERNKGRAVDPLVMTQRLGGWRSLESCARYLGLDETLGRESQFNLYKGVQT